MIRLKRNGAPRRLGRAAHRAMRELQSQLREQRELAHHHMLRRRYGECERKVRYGKQVHAELVARDSETRRQVKLKVYHCEHCEGFHLTKAEETRTA